jgi:hypothetical protein
MTIDCDEIFWICLLFLHYIRHVWSVAYCKQLYIFRIFIFYDVESDKVW